MPRETTTVHKCDHCGFEETTDGRNPEMMFFTVGIAFAIFDRAQHSANSGPRAYWCRTCCEKYHLLHTGKDPEEILPEPPTLDDLLRELIRDVVEDMQ